MTERELLALVYGYFQSEHFVNGRKVVFYTDHQPLVTLGKLKNPLGRIGRLFHQISEVDYTIEYIDGEVNYLADFLSRAQGEGVAEATTRSDWVEYVEANITEILATVDWAVEQGKDKVLCEVVRCIKSRAEDRVWQIIGGIRGAGAWLREKKELYIMSGILRHGAGMGQARWWYRII